MPNHAKLISDDDGAVGPSNGRRLRRASDELPTAEISATVKQVTDLIKARRSRSRFFRNDLFADPAWDILLDLSRAELEGHRISVSSLCGAAAVPATTALRWINTLANEDMLTRRADPLDGRRVFVELTQSASSSMRRYLFEFDATPPSRFEPNRMNNPLNSPSHNIGQVPPSLRRAHGMSCRMQIWPE